MQSENPCFGTCTRLGIINKDPSDLGLCLVSVTDHKPFPALHHLSLHKSYSVLVLGVGGTRTHTQVGSGLSDISSSDLNVSFDTTHLLALEAQATAPLLIRGRWLAEVTAQGLG